jgi:hypothetical protein
MPVPSVFQECVCPHFGSVPLTVAGRINVCLSSSMCQNRLNFGESKVHPIHREKREQRAFIPPQRALTTLGPPSDSVAEGAAVDAGRTNDRLGAG